MKSTKRIKPLSEIILAYKTTFPETIEGGVNSNSFVFRKGVEVILTYSEYECLTNSDYAKYLH